MTDHAPLIEQVFGDPPPEQAGWLEDVEGRVPAFIRGTYYLNGPARFSRGDFRYRHWLDGDGMVSALRFEDGSAHFTSRWVRTAKLAAEEQAGRPVFRAFGTAFADDRLKRGVMLESPVNVSIYDWGGALLAFGEQGLPWRLDPVTLATLGEFNFGGQVNEVSPFAAHPKFDARSGEMFNFGVGFSAREPALSLYRFDRQARLIYRRRFALPYACSIHDFGLSRSYAVFYVSPYLLDMKALVRDGRALVEALRWEPERGSRLMVVARSTGDLVGVLPVGHGYCLHFINCFEQDGYLKVDLLLLERPIYDQYQPLPDLFADVCEGQPVRFIVDPQQGELVGTTRIDYRAAPDFATVDPRRAGERCQEFWMLGISRTGQRGRKFFDQLARADWTTGTATDVYQTPPGSYLCAEPVFIPDPAEHGRGAIVCQVFDARLAARAFGVFDAFALRRGPVAQLKVPCPVPAGFHASFRPAARPRGVA